MRRVLLAPATFLILVLPSMLAGCIIPADLQFGTRHLDLTYPPKHGVIVGLPDADVENLVSLNSRFIMLDTFDARAEKTRVGADLSSFTGDADFVTEDNVAEWTKRAFSLELTEAGYNVTDSERESTNRAAIGLTVDIQKVFGISNSPLGYEAEVFVQTTLQIGSNRPAIRQYKGTGSADINLMSDGKGISESLALALQDAISKFLADFYPA